MPFGKKTGRTCDLGRRSIGHAGGFINLVTGQPVPIPLPRVRVKGKDEQAW
jgi:hypothetical protein